MGKEPLTEQEVRSRFILPAIQSAGWTLMQIREDYPITKGRIIARGGVCKRDDTSIKRADYILFYKPHIPLAVVEAKDNSHFIGDGMQQALDYAERMMIPFAFTSNADGFTLRNRQESTEKIIRLDEFPSPDTLWGIFKDNTSINEQQEKIVTEPYYSERDDKAPRYYQLNAINLTVDAVMRGQNRILLVMATGTGKTFTAFQIIWRLWKAKVKKRILFLADRNALIDQTYANDFSPFNDKMTIVRNRKIDKSYEIYLALYQGLTGDDDKDVFKLFSPSFFDLIIVDECHRGSAKADSEWREILEYFNSATQIGLTATPREEKTISNIDYFGQPIYTYSLKQGIEDGFLAPYRVIRILLDKDAEGFRPYEGQTDRFGNPIPDQNYGSSDFDRELVLEKRTQTVARVVSNYLRKHNARFDKTIFFCVDTEHADRMRQALVNENSDLVRKDERYVMRITGDDEIGKKQLDNFRDISSDYPVLVTTSKLLTTGVDVQMVKFIVLDSVINSMTEFKQIIGRGTRVREDLGKMFFTIFDFRDATRLFADPDFDGPVEQDDEFTLGQNGEMPSGLDDPPDTTPDNEPPYTDTDDDWEDPPKIRRMKYYVHNVEVTVLKELVRYIDNNGKLITESLTDYTRRNVLNQYATLEDFLMAWNSAERKQAILDGLAVQGVLFEELQEQIGQEFDLFDLLCHVAFDQPPLTRRERANNVKKRNYFGRYSEQAKVVLEALLDKYADYGVSDLESIEILNVSPFHNFGSPIYIVNKLFNGKANYEKALHELKAELYAA